MFAIGIAAFVFWLNMLIKAAKYGGEHKVVWILIILFTNILGAAIFYFVEYREKIKPQLAAQKTNTVMHS